MDDDTLSHQDKDGSRAKNSFEVGTSHGEGTSHVEGSSLVEGSSHVETVERMKSEPAVQEKLAWGRTRERGRRGRGAIVESGHPRHIYIPGLDCTVAKRGVLTEKASI